MGNRSVRRVDAAPKSSGGDLRVATRVDRHDAGPVDLYDKDGRPTEDETAAIRGEVVEVDAEGKVVATHPDLSWKVGTDLARR